jgi:hypothetical protein
VEIKLNSTINVYDAVAASGMLAKLSYPFPAEWSKVNSLFNPLGEAPARAYLLLLRKDLDSLDLNSGSFSIKFKDDERNEITANELLISREPQCVTPGKDADQNSLYLVEFSDKRHLLQPGFFSFPINEQYNVRAAGYGTDRYDETENAGSAWTWTTMVEDVWNKMTSILGAFTSLPWSPDGSPEDWKFPGVSAWVALNQILHRIGCAVAWDPTVTTGAQYEIVRVGDSDSAGYQIIQSWEPKLIYDRKYMPIERGKIPGKLVVYFGRRQEDYGTEQTTPKDNTQWTTAAVVSKEITLTVSGADSSTKHHVWDDLPAEFDVADGFTPSSTAGNDSALQTRAQERADTFQRMLTGGDLGGIRLHRVYSGLVLGRSSGMLLKGVAWRQDMVGYGTGRVGGLVTEIINHPYYSLRVEEHPASPLECWGLCSSIGTQAPAFGPTFPLYPHLLQVVELTTGTADSNRRFTATVELYDPDARTWTDKEACYAMDINGATAANSGSRFLGRLSGMDTDKPVYQISILWGSRDQTSNLLWFDTPECCESMYVPPPTRTTLTQYQDHAVLSSPYSIASDSTWEDTTLDLTLPVVGEYLLMADVRGEAEMSAGSAACITARFYDETAVAAVADSECLACFTSHTAKKHAQMGVIHITYNVTTAPTTIRLEAQRNTGPTWTTSNIGTASCGKTRTAYQLYKMV